MAAYQCPRCPLLFTFRPELELHLREDHAPPVPRPAGSPEPSDTERADHRTSEPEVTAAV